MLLGLIDDVLTDSFHAAAAEVHDCGPALESARNVEFEPLERVAVHLELEARKQVERAHCALVSVRCSRATSSSRRSSSSPLETASSSPVQYSTRFRPSSTSWSVSRRPAWPESRRLMI